jgi:hypothetical protein
LASLTQIASTIRTLAQTNLKRGSTRAYKTGNLYRKVGSANPADKMVKETKDSITITLDYSPDGAEYGKFVNDGTYKMKARPFADNAIDDPVIDRMLNDYINNVIVGNAVKEITVEVDKLGRR